MLSKRSREDPMRHIIVTAAAVVVGAAIYLLAAAMAIVGAKQISLFNSDAPSAEIFEFMKRANDLPVQEIEGLL
jgi:hypothetical protein